MKMFISLAFIGLILLFSCKKDQIEFGSITDIEGNIYKTVKIGTQVWMAENLKTTKYNDGIDIPILTDSIEWCNLATPGYCWYNNDAGTYKTIYGAYYNWYIVNTGKICPVGWHVPNDFEWTTLRTFLGGIDVAGGKLKESGTIHWHSPNKGATNETGFTAVGSGSHQCGELAGFMGNGGGGIWWSSTNRSAGTAGCWFVDSYTSRLGNDSFNCTKNFGFSVRCIKDQ